MKLQALGVYISKEKKHEAEKKRKMIRTFFKCFKERKDFSQPRYSCKLLVNTKAANYKK